MKEKILEQIAKPADPKVAERRQWTQWFGTAISEIDDSLWTDFQAESLQLVNSFKARSKRVQQANSSSNINIRISTQRDVCRP